MKTANHNVSAKPRAPKAPEQSLYDRVTAAVIGPLVARDADRARAWLDGQAVKIECVMECRP